MCHNHPLSHMKVFDTVAHFRIYTLISCPPSQKELPCCCFYSCYTGLQNCPSLCALTVFEIVLVMSETRLIFCVIWKITLRLDVWKQPICSAEARTCSDNQSQLCNRLYVNRVYLVTNHIFWLQCNLITNFLRVSSQHLNSSHSWRMKDQLDVTCYFISLLMCSTCFGH